MSLLSDAQVLKRAPLPEVRTTIAEKVSKYFNEGVFNEEETEVACDIVRLLSKDAEIRVRKKLSENLKNNSQVPRDIALSLAKDEIEVATPILEFSKVLTEKDLIAIIRSTQQVAKLTAIARREHVEEIVSSALVNTHNEEVIVCLFANKTANISEKSIGFAIDEFRNNGNVINTLVHRGGLPVPIAEKMIHFVSGEIKEQLTKEYKLSEKVARNLTESSREQATLDLTKDKTTKENKTSLVEESEEVKMAKTEQLVKHLKNEGRLTQSIVLRSLCEGNLGFFETSMAVLSGVPVMNARTLIHNHNPAALQALCKRAKLPISAIQSVQIIIDFTVNAEEEGTFNTPGFKQRMLEHIVSNGYDKSSPLMPYMMALIGSNLHVSDIVGV